MSQLSRLRKTWKRTVDNSAEAARKKFITPGDGQMLEYETKRREADLVLKLLALPMQPIEADCPWLWAEAAGLGVPLADLAATVMAQATKCRINCAQISVLRLSAKAAIDAATSEAEIVAAAQNAMIAWPRP